MATSFFFSLYDEVETLNDSADGELVVVTVSRCFLLQTHSWTDRQLQPRFSLTFMEPLFSVCGHFRKETADSWWPNVESRRFSSAVVLFLSDCPNRELNNRGMVLGIWVFAPGIMFEVLLSST